MNTTACCYTVNERYLLPTLVSARGLKANIANDEADIIIFCFGDQSPVIEEAVRYCNTIGVLFRLVPAAILDGLPLICARFFITQILDSAYENIVYLDGDTQIVSSFSNLVGFRLESGEVLAALDPMAILIDRDTRSWQKRSHYFQSIGLPSDRIGKYFNSGLMKFLRHDWVDISKDCVSLCRKKGDQFLFRDQDALNLVVGNNARHISFRWNFPPFFLNFNGHHLVKPTVYHFMSNPRPWDGPFNPWGKEFYLPYVGMRLSVPKLAAAIPPLDRLTFLRYGVQQRCKMVYEKFYWGSSAVKNRILQVEKDAVV